LKSHGLSDKGITRSQNQDAIFHSDVAVGPLPNLYIVADGMGGHNAGEVASAMAIDLIPKFLQNHPLHVDKLGLIKPDNYLDLLVTAVQHAGRAIVAMAEAEPEKKGMGTTLTACCIHNRLMLVAHIGDSRAYGISPTQIQRLTKDHTYVDELLQAGRISAEEAATHPKKHVLTRVLGAPGHCDVDGLVVELGNSTTSVLLCSDGLTNMVDDKQLLKLINVFAPTEERTDAMVQAANAAGGQDNISVVLIDLVGR
jgi:protein phosphatase